MNTSVELTKIAIGQSGANWLIVAEAYAGFRYAEKVIGNGVNSEESIDELDALKHFSALRRLYDAVGEAGGPADSRFETLIARLK